MENIRSLICGVNVGAMVRAKNRMPASNLKFRMTRYYYPILMFGI